MLVIDNTNLLRICNDCGAVGFLPVVAYAYDAVAKTVTLTNTSTIPAGDTFVKMKAKVHDFFGGTVSGQQTVLATPLVISTATLDASKPLSVCVTMITGNGIIADGGAYGLLAAGNIGAWDVEKDAADEY